NHSIAWLTSGTVIPTWSIPTRPSLTWVNQSRALSAAARARAAPTSGAAAATPAATAPRTRNSLRSIASSFASLPAERRRIPREERHLRQRREQALRRADPDGRTVARREPPHGLAVHEDRRLEVGGDVRDLDVRAARDDERTDVERVRRDEGQHERVQAPDEHGAAVREVVGGRTGGRRADEPVARLGAEHLAADRVAELDHPPERAAGDHDVVHGRGRLALDLDLERRQLDRPVVASEDALHAGLEVLAAHRRQEADPAVVDADRRHARPEQPPERPQHRAVAAQNDREVGAVAELDAVPLGDRAQPRDRVVDAVAPDRGDARAPNRRHGRSSRRALRGARGAPGGGGGGRTHGFPSVLAGPSLRP